MCVLERFALHRKPCAYFVRKQALPESFGGLASLRSLDASHNVLETLPSSIGRCTALVTLDLTHNKLWELPTEVLATMTQLTNLELRHNKLCVAAAGCW